ncbi:choice-of-anchor A family protein [bacterium]|nr:MAG: choice-of-anchor A family protein [bacterium]
MTLQPAVAALALVVLAGVASADPLGPAAGRFNAFTFGNLEYSSNDTDGPLAAGGNLKINGAFQVNSLELGATLGTPLMSNVGLLTGGNLIGPANAADLKIKGNAYVAGTVSGGAPQYQSGSLYTGAAVDTSVFAKQLQYSIAQSAAIRGLTSGGTITGSGNSFTMNLATLPTLVIDGQSVKRPGTGRRTLRRGTGCSGTSSRSRRSRSVSVTSTVRFSPPGRA